MNFRDDERRYAMPKGSNGSSLDCLVREQAFKHCHMLWRAVMLNHNGFYFLKTGGI